MHKANRPYLPTAFLLLVGLFATAGCSTTRDATAPPATIKRLAALDFPVDRLHGPDPEDILIIRSGGQIRIVNRTANDYTGMQLWLNGQYVADNVAIRIGTDNVRELTAFINRFEEPYPVGTFLNPDQTMPLRMAELYDPDTKLRYRVDVRPGNESTIVPFEDIE